MLGLALLAAGAVSASPQVLAAREAIWSDDAIDPAVVKWARRPTGDDMAKAYPRSGLPKGQTGLILLQCRISTTGNLELCAPLMSGPAGFGFAEAALSLTSKFRLRSPSEQTAGKTIRIPIKFIVNGPGRPAPPGYENPFGNTRCLAAFYSPDVPLSPAATFFLQGVSKALAWDGFSRDEQLQWLAENYSRLAPPTEENAGVRAACLAAFPDAPAAASAPP